MSKAGYIYALINPLLEGSVKICKSATNPEKQANDIYSDTAAGVPTQSLVAYSVLVTDCDLAEKYIHGLLEKNGCHIGVNHDFFQAPLPVVIDAINNTAKFVGSLTESQFHQIYSDSSLDAAEEDCWQNPVVGMGLSKVTDIRSVYQVNQANVSDGSLWAAGLKSSRSSSFNSRVLCVVIALITGGVILAGVKHNVYISSGQAAKDAADQKSRQDLIQQQQHKIADDLKEKKESAQREESTKRMEAEKTQKAIEDLYNLRESVKHACEEEVRREMKYECTFSTTNAKWGITDAGFWVNKNSFLVNVGDSHKSAYYCLVDASNGQNGVFIVKNLNIGMTPEFY